MSTKRDPKNVDSLIALRFVKGLDLVNVFAHEFPVRRWPLSC